MAPHADRTRPRQVAVSVDGRSGGQAAAGDAEAERLVLPDVTLEECHAHVANHELSSSRAWIGIRGRGRT